MLLESLTLKSLSISVKAKHFINFQETNVIIEKRDLRRKTVNTHSDDCPSYAIVTNCVSAFKRGTFFIQDDERPSSKSLITISSAENIVTVHDSISNHQIGQKH